MVLVSRSFPFRFLSTVRLAQADNSEPARARGKNHDMKTQANLASHFKSFLVVVEPRVRLDCRRCPINPSHSSEIHAVFGEVGLAFVFVVGCASAHLGPHLYTYIKGMCKWPVGALGEGRGDWLMRGVGCAMYRPLPDLISIKSGALPRRPRLPALAGAFRTSQIGAA